MERYILSHDMGTGSDKAVLVDYSGNIAATAVAPSRLFIQIRRGRNRILKTTGRP